MITFISYIIKIVLSIAIANAIVYFIYTDNNQTKKILYKQFSNVSLLGSSFIAFIYIYSNNINNHLLYIIGILISVVFIFKYYDQFNDREISSLIFLNFVSIIMITAGYVLYAILVVVLYYYINHNFIFFNETEEENEILDDADENIL